ncbi:MAG: mannosyl-3-phosphoglycerate synthase [Proteobacteria bacterium]|nr:mannosyl-3-phosphoglycerate synthase [Pseudomonadota bacterium]MBU4381785.1 mannosyl-3-phosphoglycerate synthase [Pseudomonadota bacterium]MBU4603489.1 mannosyl-3-phosphoglycerate synthase [Pseudomonadota bacterium]MCG2765740.1 mannosyl-3-phosphoglycerate synthase [Desulfarculaceae bacterium]
MPSFAQTHSRVTSYYVLQDKQDILQQLVHAARWKKPVLIVPALASEFTDPENRPVFENIVAELSGAKYLAHVIFGLDQASEEDVRTCIDICQKGGLKNYIIQWNDGPAVRGIYEMLGDGGFDISRRGKGRNVFMGFGVAMALGATCVGLLDADIKTFQRRQLDRLFYPVLVHNYPFSKAFYARWNGQRLFGRVKRLLLDPLLLALKRKFSEGSEEKMLRLVDFLLSFDYQLSGEVCLDMWLLRKMRYSLNWGVEIFTLIEVYRKASHVAQVEFTRKSFDHKHQRVSTDDPTSGLHKMSLDIIQTLLHALIVEEGLEVGEEFFRDLALTYESIAEEIIKKYSDNAEFNNLNYDRDAEESMVYEVLSRAIVQTADHLSAPSHIAEKMLRLTATYDVFKPFVDQGLQQTILRLEEKLKEESLEVRSLPSWERILWKLPEVSTHIVDALEEDKQRFK